MENKFDVFISYSSNDQKIAEGICGYLERHNYRCFVAYRDIPRGMPWAKFITEAIDSSKLMVVVFSKHFDISAQTDREIELASENGMPILTFRITDSLFTGAKKYYLKNLNCIDAFPNPVNCFGILLNSISKLIETESTRKNIAYSQSVLMERELFPIKKNEKWGYIDEYCNIVIPCEWKDVGGFSEGLARVQDFNNSWGCINQKGTIVIPNRWIDIGYFNDGIAPIKDDNGKWGGY